MKRIISVIGLSIVMNINSLSFSASEQTKTIAVSEFSNNTGLSSLEHFKKGLSDSLINNIAGYKSFTVLERNKIDEAMKELALGQSGFVSPETAVKLGKLVGSQYIIFGSILKSGQQFQVSLRLVETETGRIILGESLDCPNEESVINSVNYLSLKTAGSLGENIDKKRIEEAKRNIELRTGNDYTWAFITGGIIIIVGIVASVTGFINFFKD